jgi:hypothetical protein
VTAARLAMAELPAIRAEVEAATAADAARATAQWAAAHPQGRGDGSPDGRGRAGGAPGGGARGGRDPDGSGGPDRR